MSSWLPSQFEKHTVALFYGHVISHDGIHYSCVMQRGKTKNIIRVERYNSIPRLSLSLSTAISYRHHCHFLHLYDDFRAIYAMILRTKHSVLQVFFQS